MEEGGAYSAGLYVKCNEKYVSGSKKCGVKRPFTKYKLINKKLTIFSNPKYGVILIRTRKIKKFCNL